MNSITSANPSSGVIVLQGTQNYLEWLYTIEMAANSGTQNVWQYINPVRSSNTSPEFPSVPQKPTPRDVVMTANTVSDLTTFQLDDYKLRLADWKEQKLEIDEAKRLLSTVQNKILGSISEKLLPQLKGKSTVSEILCYLNKRFRPTDQARRQEVISRWNKIKKVPKNQSIISWLDDWDSI
ncbi:hypothetical protein K3495_g16075 [Podosphaera aphanis]|nr:hypothetical protein K3495_g16075 [Podosphaera aphanis]